ncbi:MAG: metallophosphatase [Prevotella sp.]|nr:metallophosphatase [Prevotella sp.]
MKTLSEKSNQWIKAVSFLFVIYSFVFSPAWAQKTLTILHTNDTHSTILPLNPALADTLVAGRGGYLRRMAMIEEERRLDPDLLLFDSGDFSQGSAFYSMFQGDVEIGLMNQMHYDAVTIGNHEFDFGLDNMVRIFRQAEFPVVCSNYDFAGTELEDIVKPYIVIKRKGIKIGVFALCPPLEGLVFTANYGPLRFLDPVEVTNRMVDILRRQKKCDYVICISHLGWERSVYPDEQFIAATRGVDLVLGGHTHTYFEELQYANNVDGQPVPVDQNGKHAVYVGKLLLTFSKK